MRTIEMPELAGDGTRDYPWSAGGADPSFKYYDFKSHPELIPLVLEDFIPYSDKEAVKQFYELLAWINGPESAFETDDCAFRGPVPHNDPHSDLKLRCYGRVFVLFRELKCNINLRTNQWLTAAIAKELQQIDAAFSEKFGFIAVTQQTIIFLPVPHKSRNEIRGTSSMMTFWAYGNTEEEVFTNLGRLFANLRLALERLSNYVKANADRFLNSG